MPLLLEDAVVSHHAQFAHCLGLVVPAIGNAPFFADIFSAYIAPKKGSYAHTLALHAELVA